MESRKVDEQHINEIQKHTEKIIEFFTEHKITPDFALHVFHQVVMGVTAAYDDMELNVDVPLLETYYENSERGDLVIKTTIQLRSKDEH